MSCFLNSQRASDENNKLRLFYYHLECSTSINSHNDDLGNPDIVFVIGSELYRAHQKVLSNHSLELKTCFDAVNSGCLKYNHGVIRRIGRSKSLDVPTISLDTRPDVFEAFFNYCYNLKLNISYDSMPLLYSLSRNLKVRPLQTICANFLSKNVCTNSIGTLIHLIQFKRLTELSLSNNDESVDTECDMADIELTKSVYHYLSTNANIVTCSRTSQLIARLIVNLTGELNSSIYQNPPTDEWMAFGVLQWVYEKFLTGDNVQSENKVVDDDDDNDDQVNNMCYSFAKLDILMNYYADSSSKNHGLVHDGFDSFASNNGEDDNTSDQDQSDAGNKGLKLSKSVEKTNLFCTQDIRITLNVNDVVLVLMKNVEIEKFSNSFREDENLLSIFCPVVGSSEWETCLLTSTLLGVGSTKIWLGKLMGCLVSLSIKQCFDPNQRHVDNVVSMGNCPFNDQACQNFDNEPHESNPLISDVVITTNANRTSHYSNGNDGDIMGLGQSSSTPFNNTHNLHCKFLTHDNNLVRMLEFRSGLGCGLLHVDSQSELALLVVGGYARDGCSNTVELYRHLELLDKCGLSTLPQYGPCLSNPRGRLGCVHSLDRNHACDSSQPLAAHVLYACGGSTGSKDLSSVEILTSTALTKWIKNQEILTSHGGQDGPSHILHCPWQSVSNMNQSRSSLTAVDLSRLHSGGPLISNCTGSIMVIGGLSDARALNSIEAYIPERNQWIELPPMCTGRRESSAQILQDRNLIVVAGGIPHYTCRTDPVCKVVEALDLRCPDWIQLPNPPMNLCERIQGMTMTVYPNAPNQLLMIGGYDGHYTLDSTCIFDPIAWNWQFGPSLQMGRSNSCSISLPSYNLVFGGYNPLNTTNAFLDTIEIIC